MKTNKDRHALSAAEIFDRDSSFWQYKVCADICSGSLERRRQTTVGSRVMRTCCGRMLKFICCVRNKLTGSSDVRGICNDLFISNLLSSATVKNFGKNGEVMDKSLMSCFLTHGIFQIHVVSALPMRVQLEKRRRTTDMGNMISIYHHQNLA